MYKIIENEISARLNNVLYNLYNKIYIQSANYLICCVRNILYIQFERLYYSM